MTLRKARAEDVRIVFGLSNDPVVREASFHPRPIVWEEHERWFGRALEDPQILFLLAFEGEALAGQVRFQSVGVGEEEVSISIHRDFRSKGCGMGILEDAIARLLGEKQVERIHAYVKDSNSASRRFFLKCGFQSAGEEPRPESPQQAVHFIRRLEKGGRQVSPKRTMIVAELSANHGHRLETALQTVRAAAVAGADAIKLQTYTADTLTIDCDNEHFQIHSGSPWDGRTLYSLYQEAYTPWEWHEPIRDEAARLGLTFFSTPFDPSAVDFLESLGVGCYKIASFEIRDIPLIEYAASKGKRMILSTGIATRDEIDEALHACRRVGNQDLDLLKCTSAYPAPISEANLLTLADMKSAFGVRVGLSDHTLGATAALAAVALGAEIVEKHFILDRSIGGPDAAFSMVPEDFSVMVRGIRDVEQALGCVSYELSPLTLKSRVFGRSLYVVKDVAAGEPFTRDNVRSIRPDGGLHPRHLPDVMKGKAARALRRGTPLAWEDVESRTGTVGT